MNHPPPYPVWPSGGNFPRKAVWRGAELVPGVHLRATAELRPSLAGLAHRPSELLLSVTQAASAALSLHPRLNYFNYWGGLAWAGEPVRVAVVMENPDLTCDLVTIAAAHQMPRQGLRRALRERERQNGAGAWDSLRERFPLACHLAARYSGHYRRSLCRLSAPLFISMLGLKGIEDLTYTPTHSMALYPGWPQGGRLPLTLCFSHQLANARPVGRFLLTIKELLE